MTLGLQLTLERWYKEWIVVDPVVYTNYSRAHTELKRLSAAQPEVIFRIKGHPRYGGCMTTRGGRRYIGSLDQMLTFLVVCS